MSHTMTVEKVEVSIDKVKLFLGLDKAHHKVKYATMPTEI